MAIDQQHVERYFADHTPRDDQKKQYKKIRNAAKAFAMVILDNTPSSADQSCAIRHVRDACSAANMAIACGGM